MSTPQYPPSAHHSLAFRVMRLCRPSFQAEDAILRLDPFDLFAGEDLFDDPSVSPSLLDGISGGKEKEKEKEKESSFNDSSSYRGRYQVQSPTDAMALSGILMVPQSFGAIYLGETFCSYISVNNSSSLEVRDVVLKAEIQTEKQRISLFATKMPIESIRSGGRYDFIVEHDVKELGPHTLVCTALYNDGEAERKYLPQFFKFAVANPLSVRTKVRSVKGIMYVEACIENHTKSNLLMDQVEFEPTQNWSATVLKANTHPSDVSLTREAVKPPVLIKSGGGIHNYLYQLKQSSHEPEQIMVEGSNILGKLQITWRTNLGEPGRLQTQHILSTPTTKKEIDIHVLGIPSTITLERPFLVHLALQNHTDKKLGPFELCVSLDDVIEDKAVMVAGLQKVVLPQVDPFGSTEFNLEMIATKLGVQKLSEVTVIDPVNKKIYDSLSEVEIYVVSD